MKILCVGVPLRLRARLQGEMPDAELQVARSESEFLAAARQFAFPAVVLCESVLERPLREVLEGLPADFPAAIVLVVNRPHPGTDLQLLVRSHHVVCVLQEPPRFEDVVKALIVELGMNRVAAAKPGAEQLPLEEVLQESKPTLLGWLDRLEEVLDPESRDEDKLGLALQAAQSLTNNFGSFELAKGGLLAREAQQLIHQALDGHPLREQRLGQVIDAMNRMLVERAGHARPPRRLIYVGDDMDFLSQLDLEARLLQWECDVCYDFPDLPVRLEHPESRVVVVDAAAGTCQHHPRLLEELIWDPFPVVVLSAPPLQPDTPSSRWLEAGTSAYRVMLAAERIQVAPALDRPPGILIVDDDRVTSLVIKRCLTQVDFHVESLHSPLEFWDALEARRPDLIIMEIDLPTFSGLELCRALRMDDRYCTIPLLFLSGYADSRTVQKAYEAGADDFIFKPVVPGELRTRVSNRLERCRQRAAHAGRSLPTGRTYTSLDQLILRSLREGVPLLLGVIALPEGGQRRKDVAQALRAHLRGEDVLRALGETELLIALLSPSLEHAEERLRHIMAGLEPAARIACSSLDDEHCDFSEALEMVHAQLTGPLA